MNLVSNTAEAIQNKGVVTVATANRFVDRPIMGYDDVLKGESFGVNFPQLAAFPFLRLAVDTPSALLRGSSLRCLVNIRQWIRNTVR